MGTPELSAMKGVIRMPNKFENSPNSTENLSFETLVKTSKKNFASPSTFLKTHHPKLGSENFDLENNIVMMENFALDSSDDEEEEEDTQSKIVYEST